MLLWGVGAVLQWLGDGGWSGLRAMRGIRPKKLEPETAAKGASTKYNMKDVKLYRARLLDTCDDLLKSINSLFLIIQRDAVNVQNSLFFGRLAELLMELSW